MDSLKSLIDSRNYDLVIKLTDKSKDVNDLFYRIAAFTCLGKYDEALYVIQDNQKILEGNMTALIPIHIQLLCTLQRYDQAQSILEYYQNLPYVSQVVEEILRKMPDYILSEEKKSNSIYYNDDEVIDKLNSKDKEEVLFGLDLVKKRDVFTFLPYINKILTSYPNQTIRSLALMLLVEKEVDRNLKYLSKGELIDVNPKHIEPPFRGDVFDKIVKKMDMSYKDATLSTNGAQILSSYVIYIFPHQLDNNVEEIALAVYIIAKRLMSFEIDIKKECESRALDEKRVKKYVNEIEEALNDF